MLEAFKFDFCAYRWPILFCAISSIGSLVFGYDNTYYTGILGMTPFKNNYGNHLDENGHKALSVSFTSLTTSTIYIGDALGAFLSAPLNDKFGRKAVFYGTFSPFASSISKSTSCRYGTWILVFYFHHC